MRLLCIQSSVGEEPNVYEGEEYHATDILDFQYIDKKFGPLTPEQFPVEYRNSWFYELAECRKNSFFWEGFFEVITEKSTWEEVVKECTELQTVEC